MIKTLSWILKVNNLKTTLKNKTLILKWSGCETGNKAVLNSFTNLATQKQFNTWVKMYKGSENRSLTLHLKSIIEIYLIKYGVTFLHKH